MANYVACDPTVARRGFVPGVRRHRLNPLGEFACDLAIAVRELCHGPRSSARRFRRPLVRAVDQPAIATDEAGGEQRRMVGGLSRRDRIDARDLERAKTPVLD